MCFCLWEYRLVEERLFNHAGLAFVVAEYVDHVDTTVIVCMVNPYAYVIEAFKLSLPVIEDRLKTNGQDRRELSR